MRSHYRLALYHNYTYSTENTLQVDVDTDYFRLNFMDQKGGLFNTKNYDVAEQARLRMCQPRPDEPLGE